MTELPKRKPAEVEPTELLAVGAASGGRGPHEAKLEEALERLDLRGADVAAVALCRTLARSMDFVLGDPKDVAMLAPKYLAALRALKATPDTAPPAAQEAPGLRLTAY